MVTSWVLHVDLDQFIAAVEVLRRPGLRGKPVVVGGDGDPGKRGVVSTASYEARAHGVHSGQPLRTARRLCPDAVFLAVDRAAYEAASAQVMAVLRESGAVVEVMGWDEAFLQVETYDPEAFARLAAERVRERTQLDCSVGIGENKLQAKLATGFGKPAGVFRLTSANWDEVMGARPTDALWGIGAKTAAKLAALGIGTVRELAVADPSALAARFGPRPGRGWSGWAAVRAARRWTRSRGWQGRAARRRRSSATWRSGAQVEAAVADVAQAAGGGAGPRDGGWWPGWWSRSATCRSSRRRAASRWASPGGRRRWSSRARRPRWRCSPTTARSAW